ncbi:nicotinate-nucleotide adenylyltransferase [Litorimonas haliclonae]|uniref:nicotinate-nucleotide adenylyltransferase n=1 Tax=Litorimonas haliclonae TaxID=2081977 RepID=UPI0039EEB866
MYEGLKIGLFGGSFNPAHPGHLHVATSGLRELGLDHIWWLVSPQNPLKPEQPSYDSRVETVKALNLPPRMDISHVEKQFGTNYTIDLLRRLKKRYPRTHFVFMMGADNFAQLPKWRSWQEIMSSFPIAVISRPGNNIKARLGQAARQYADYRLPEQSAASLAEMTAPRWTYLTLPLDKRSSSALRVKLARD